INEEVFATTVILGAVALALAGVVLRPAHDALLRFARALAAAGIAFAVLAGPALVYQLTGPGHVHGLFVQPGKYVNDLAGFVVPNRRQWLSTAGMRHTTDGF